MFNKLKFIKVPNFKKEVDEEDKPDFYYKLAKDEQEEYCRNLVQSRALLWACRTAAAGYNLTVVIGLFILIKYAVEIGTWIQVIAKKILGIP